MRVMNAALICALALACSAGLLAAEERLDAGISVERIRRVGAKLQEFVETERLPGAVTIIYRRGKIVDAQAVGWQDREQRTPMRRDTIFRLASMTKPITAVAMMMLIEDGKIAFDDPLDRWLPELANRQVLLDPEGPLDKTKLSPRPITVRDLLMYRIGLGMNAASGSAPITKAAGSIGGNLTGDEWVKRLATLPLAASPGERFIYNTPSQLMGVLVARVSGMPFDTFLQQRIFQPLGMKDTAFWVPLEKRSRLATAYTFDEKTGKLQVNKSPLAGMMDTPPVFPSGAGGLVTTADDYLKFARMLLQKGEVDGVRLLSPKAVQVMTTDYMTKEDRKRANFGDVFDNQGFGYGLAVVSDSGFIGPSIGSFHWDGASGASWIADPKEDLITIVLMQQYNYGVASRVVRDVNTLVYSAIVN